MTDLKPGTLVSVEWDDAGTNPGWATTKRARSRRYEMETVGWVLAESDERYLQLAATRTNDKKEHGDVSAIPRGCIRKVTEIGAKTSG